MICGCHHAPAEPVGHEILFAIIIPIITPKSPRAEAKICTINIDTKVLGVYACDKAVAVPITPTDKPQTKFERPTTPPIAKIQKPENSAC